MPHRPEADRPKHPAKHTAKHTATQAAAGAPHEVRIIGGQWRRTKLAVVDRPGLRPTPDRVRETLFNWLGQDLSGWHCVDLFAGSGALGLEAASRGALQVQLFEFDAAAVRSLLSVCQRLQATQVQVTRGDALALAHALPAVSIDLAFIDPPYASDLFEPALRAVRAALKPQGRVFLEAPQAWTDAALAPLGYQLLRHLKAGAVHAHLLMPTA
ncbi:MAG: 16S rRNA (guanine(966)-N(2))-methyltransferase RsmD [Burkholderiaceae bacterium]